MLSIYGYKSYIISLYKSLFAYGTNVYVRLRERTLCVSIDVVLLCVSILDRMYLCAVPAFAKRLLESQEKLCHDTPQSQGSDAHDGRNGRQEPQRTGCSCGAFL